MPKRHEPSQDEIEALAATFRALWRRGKPLRPWLRKHRQMVLDLVHDEWSWNSIAKVFSVADIKYREGKGKDWHGEELRSEFARAALPLKRDKNRTNVIDGTQQARSNQVLAAEKSAPATDHSEARAVAPVAAQTMTPMPRFKPVSLRPAEPRQMPTAEELAEIEQNRRLTFGRS